VIKTVTELLSSPIEENSIVTVSCKLIGTIDGQFTLIDRNEQEFPTERSIAVSIPGVLKLLLNAGLGPRGGGMFPYGGNATIRGMFAMNADHGGRLCLVDFESIEIEVHRRMPVRAFKKADVD